MEVLASGRSDEEIQSDLVEILGFEGEGFTLVELILRPGARRDIIATERGGKVRLHHSHLLSTLPPPLHMC
jgi:antiviral helicase SLH1